jgi:hypothetical protein
MGETDAVSSLSFCLLSEETASTMNLGCMKLVRTRFGIIEISSLNNIGSVF